MDNISNDKKKPNQGNVGREGEQRESDGNMVGGQRDIHGKQLQGGQQGKQMQGDQQGKQQQQQGGQQGKQMQGDQRSTYPSGGGSSQNVGGQKQSQQTDDVGGQKQSQQTGSLSKPNSNEENEEE